jgi:hypothetical protein
MMHGAMSIDARLTGYEFQTTRLLDEYWFDALEKSQKARERLLEGF